MLEKELRKPINNWLLENHLEDAHECLLSGYCDVLGFRFYPRIGRRIPELETVIGIELKLKDIGGVLSQARNNQYFVNASYAAMPENICKRMRQSTKEKFRIDGIGLISVNIDLNKTKIIIPAIYKSNENIHRKKRALWRWHLKNKKAA
tara:strand:- start:65 stop:511 length:447 start_codon:yes stop_codon:yes gene_type:complete